MSSYEANNQGATHQQGSQNTARQQRDQQSTRQKHAEKALQKSEQLFRAVWEAASDAMALSNFDGTVFAANPAYFRLYGYQAEEVIGKNFAVIFPKEQQKSAQALYKHTFISPTIKPSFVTPVIRADGTERMVESSYDFITYKGQRIAMLSIIRDITERKRAEEALWISEEKLLLALQAANLNSWDWDIGSNTIYWPPQLEAAFGLAPGNLGTTYEDFLALVHPQERSLVDQKVRWAIEVGSDYKIEFRIVRPDGTVRWTTIHGQVLYDEAGKPSCMVVIDMDITERRRSPE